MSARRTTRMVPLGYGKFVRADRIVMVEPLTGDEGRGDGSRTRVWVDGVADPVIASRSERAILEDMGELPGRSRSARRIRSSGQEELF
jgi:hypothetical protein